MRWMVEKIGNEDCDGKVATTDYHRLPRSAGKDQVGT
jgi:hypothetical protein